MDNTPCININKFECRLVNPFGDGHNHELEQFKSLSRPMERIAAAKGFDGILLGNVYCDNVSLDSLLLTSFGVFVIEFKSYPKVARVRITGQKEFQCLNSKGERITLPEGGFLNVKGGSLASPYDQAKKNRIAVFNTLKRVFGEEKACSIHVGVAIVFNGKLAIEGIDSIIESERRWLTVVDSVGFEQFMVYTSGERTKGLSVSEREALIKHMDANSSIPVKVDLFKQAQEYYYLGLYETAYQKAMSCDSTNPAVMQLLLESLFRAKKKDLKVFHSLIVSARSSMNPKLVNTANKLVGLSRISGINGFTKNAEEALSYLQNADRNDNEVLQAIDSIIREMQLKKKKEEEEKKEQDREKALEHALEMEEKRERAFNSRTSEVLDKAGHDYLECARIAVTALIIIPVFFIIAVLMPHNGINWNVVAAICSGISILGVMCWTGEKGSENAWLVRKTPLKHTEGLPFRAISVRSKSFLKGDRLYKTILCVAAFFLYFGLSLYVFYRIVKVGTGYLMSMDSVRHFVEVVVAKTSIDTTVFLPGLLLGYCIINILAIAFPLIDQLTDGVDAFPRVNDGKDDCYRIAIPDLKKDASYKLSSTVFVLFKESLAFSVKITLALCVLGWARPLLYRIFSILFS